ncbi:MAG TPA: hypothetical protein VN665_02410, partial [Candidatus Paceibacterota bacterium]|nr:hypothetical protein [Candidatus Paceibacterota bacterium]
MSIYRTAFPKRHTFLPVIHAEGPHQVIRNIEVSIDNGADGAFLINHYISPEALLGLYAEARLKHPDFWIGLNVLGRSPIEALKLVPYNLDGLWADDPGVRPSGDTSVAEAFNRYRQLNANWNG